MSESWISVVTTLPQSLGAHGQSGSGSGNESHQEIRTERLILRPLTQSDLAALHRLRSQPKYVKYTLSGVPDADLRVTQEKLDSIINAPKSPDSLPFHVYFGIFLRATGELIGDGGVHILASSACGWPEVGVKLGDEYCNSGYGTEFLRAFTAWWWDLPRHREHGTDGPVPVRLRVHPDSVVRDPDGRARDGTAPVDGDEQAIEQLYAWIAPENYASQRTATKSGLEHFTTWEHPLRKVPVLGWRQSRYQRFVYPTKL